MFNFTTIADVKYNDIAKNRFVTRFARGTRCDVEVELKSVIVTLKKYIVSLKRCCILKNPDGGSLNVGVGY